MAAAFSSPEVIAATGAHATGGAEDQVFPGVSTDTRALPAGCLFVALQGERFDAHDFLAQAVAGGARGLVVQTGRGAPFPGVRVFEVPDTLAALGALGRFHRRRFAIPIGAVTGSNGKTTTKELVGAILETRGPALKTQGNLNNEVGAPLTLLGLSPEHRAAIVELGMNHLGEIARIVSFVEPDAGLITCVQPVHLEGLGTLDNVGTAKGELFRGLPAGATAVVNLDDAQIVKQAQGLARKQVTYGRAAGAQVRLASVTARGAEGLELVIRFEGQAWPLRLALLGEHNAMNATGAFALAVALGFSPAECVRGLESARAHARRLQLTRTAAGVTVVDDCYNANPASMTAGLATLAGLASGGRAVAVLGDMLELGAYEAEAHAQMGPTAAKHAQVVAFFGPRMKAAFAAARGVEAAHFEDVAALLAWLTPRLKASDVVLVKGSRGMRLERVVEGLTGQSSGGSH